MHYARYTPYNFQDHAAEDFNVGYAFDQFKAATEILFRRRMWVDDTPALGVESAMPGLFVTMDQVSEEKQKSKSVLPSQPA